MKLYLFYLKKDMILVDEYPGVKIDEIRKTKDDDELCLYAYTNKKEYRDIFKKMHKKCFIEITRDIECNDDDEFENLINNLCQYDGHELYVEELTTNCYDEAGFSRIETVEVVMTHDEFESVINFSEFYIIDYVFASVDDLFVKLFMEKVFKENIMRVLKEKLFLDDFIPSHPSEIESYEDYIYDQITIYSKLYENILN